MNEKIALGFFKEAADMKKEAVLPLLAGAARALPLLARVGSAMGGVKGVVGAVGSNMAMNAGTKLLGGGTKPAKSPAANAMPQKSAF